MDEADRAPIDELIRRGAYAEAGGILEEKIARAPGDWGLQAKLGHVLHSGGHHAAAIRHYGEAAWILVTEAVGRTTGDPNDSFEPVLLASGEILNMVRPACFEQARMLLGRTLDYARVRTEMGVSLLELGDIPTARRAFCEAVEFLPAGTDYDEPWLWLTRIEDL